MGILVYDGRVIDDTERRLGLGEEVEEMFVQVSCGYLCDDTPRHSYSFVLWFLAIT